jgi:hypothetical protein
VRFRFEDVPIESPDLKVRLEAVQGVVRGSHGSWLVSLVCAEPSGCAGEFSVEVDYDTGTSEARLVISRQLQASDGETMRFEGLQDPPRAVNRVARVKLEVVSRLGAGESFPEVED